MPQNKMTVAQAFDEWMRKYKEDPDGFANAMQSARAHERPSEDTTASEYGFGCARLLADLQEHGTDAWDTLAARARYEAAGLTVLSDAELRSRSEARNVEGTHEL
jgi:hypothetical protein